MVLNPDIFSVKEDILIAEGVREKMIEEDRARISNFEVNLTNEGPLPDNPLELSRTVFDRMHRQLLLKYSENDSSLDTVLKKGFYNHISAVLLYNSLMEDQGFTVSIAEDSSNILSLVNINGINIYSDAANPSGYDMEIIQGRPAEIIYSGKRGILSFVYSELSINELRAGLFYNAYQCALKSLAVSSEPASIDSNLQPAVSGYALYLANYKKDYADALSVLNEAVNYFSQKEIYLNNYFYVVDKYLNYLTETSQYDRAMMEMSRYLHLAGENESYKNDFYFKIFNRVINHDGDFQKGYEISKGILAEMPKNDSIRILIINAYKRLCRKLTDGWRYYPKGEDLMLEWYQLLKNDYFDTILEDYYNQTGLKYFEYGNPERGLEIIREGLNRFPQSKTLSNDIVYISGSSAIICLRRGDFENGIKYTRIGLSEDPANESLHSNIISISIYAANYYFKTGNYDGVIKYANTGLSEDPKNMILLFLMRSGYRQYVYNELARKNYNKALSLSEEGLKLFPSDGKLLFYREFSLKRAKVDTNTHP
jgi:tetratricopeptide (TPR) repeat protein